MTYCLTGRTQFGHLICTDQEGARRLYIGPQCQGGVYLEPPASVVSAELDGPGPIGESPYFVGWLIAGLHNPDGSYLMTGLGSGGGAVQLLYSFPNTTVTILEIDPVVIRCACEAYPLLNHYQDLGRLQIIRGDASELLDGPLADDRWDVGLHDAFDGSYDVLEGPVERVVRQTRYRYVNCIDRLGGPSMAAQVSLLDLTALYKVEHLWGLRFDEYSNWILTDQPQDRKLLDGWRPFESIDYPSAQTIRTIWASTIRNGMQAVDLG